MRCERVKPNGERCRAPALPDRALCWAHDPEYRAKAEAARRAGGQNSSTAARAGKYLSRELRGLADTLLTAIDQVHEGKLDPKRLTAMAAGASAVVRLHEVGELRLEVREIRERLDGGAA